MMTAKTKTYKVLKPLSSLSANKTLMPGELYTPPASATPDELQMLIDMGVIEEVSEGNS